jgi:integrase
MTRQKLCYQKGSVQFHNGQWSLRYRELNHATGVWKSRREQLGKHPSKKAARQAADPLIAAANERNNNPSIVKTQTGITFKEFVEGRWKAYTVRHKRATMDSWGSLIKNHLLPNFGDKVLEQITPTDIAAFFNDLHSKMEPNTLQSFYNLLRLMLDVAEQYDVIVKSPIRSKLHRSRVPKVDKPTLNAEQIKRVIDCMPENEQLLCQLLAVTGIRLNEAQALRWMDFKHGTITTNHGLYRGELQPPKTEATRRTIQLAPVVVGLLMDFKARSNFQALDDFIFCRPDGSPHNPATLRNHLRVAMMLVVDWQPRKFGFHIFRHSAGTLVYNQSRDLKLVQGTLGHSNIQTTANIYIHQSEAVRAEAGEYLASEILAPSVPFDESRAG